MTLHNGPSRPVAVAPAESSGREPSMDDILASIRRIIADDDALPLSNSARAAQRAATSTPTSAQTTAGHAAGNHATAAPNPAAAKPGAEATPHAAPASCAQTRASSQSPAAPMPMNHPRLDRAPTLKLRDFAPSSAALPPTPAAIDAAAERPHDAAAATPIATQQLRRETPAPVASLAEARLKASARAESHLPPAEAAPAELRGSVAPPDARVETSASPASASPSSASAASASSASASLAPVRAAEDGLISAQTSAKISASFSALSENLLLRDPELIERLARDMLRPMLKNWLDAHLPDLVERLVRAEIERISRG